MLGLCSKTLGDKILYYYYCICTDYCNCYVCQENLCQCSKDESSSDFLRYHQRAKLLQLLSHLVYLSLTSHAYIYCISKQPNFKAALIHTFSCFVVRWQNKLILFWQKIWNYHHLRKFNQLFFIVEKKGITGDFI